jgi:hypothetical protein
VTRENKWIFFKNKTIKHEKIKPKFHKPPKALYLASDIVVTFFFSFFLSSAWFPKGLGPSGELAIMGMYFKTSPMN